MELIEETLKLSPLYFTLSQQEVSELIKKLSADFDNPSEDEEESTVN